MRVDAGSLRDTAPDLATVAATVDAALGRLQTALAAEGECWGGDETGRAFGTGYAPLCDRAQQAFAALGQAIETIGTDLGSVAERARAADDRASARLR
jgi:uncharacterized protein YukE